MILILRSFCNMCKKLALLNQFLLNRVCIARIEHVSIFTNQIYQVHSYILLLLLLTYKVMADGKTAEAQDTILRHFAPFFLLQYSLFSPYILFF